LLEVGWALMADYANEYRGVPVFNQKILKMNNFERYIHNSDSNTNNNVNNPLTEEDYDSDPDIFIRKLSEFIENLKNQQLTKNYLNKSKKEYKHLSKFMLKNGLYLIREIGRDSEKSSKIYGLLIKLQEISAKRYPDGIDIFQSAMRKNAVNSRNQKKSRKTRKRKLRKAH
jgi:hypothetical protein